MNERRSALWGAASALLDRAPVRFGRLLVAKISADDLPGLAAEMAFRFLFALFPFLLFLAALVGFVGARVGAENLFAAGMAFLALLAPPEVQQVLDDAVAGMVGTHSPALLSLGALGALWGAAGGLGTLNKGLNRAYEVAAGRPFWIQQPVALVATMALAVLMLGGVALYAFGEGLGQLMAAHLGLGDRFLALWTVLRGPGVAGGLALVLLLLYALLPNTRVGLRQAAPGALFATVGWVALTVGFSFYLSNFGSYDRTFGSLGAAAILMVWMYFVSVVLLIGGELNALLARGPRSPSP